MKRLWLAFAAVAAMIPDVIGAQQIDVSNVIDRPNCLIDVEVKLLDLRDSSVGPTQPNLSRRIPTEVRIRYNGAAVELPAGFAEIFWDASRILPLGDDRTCGFQVDRGDASTSNRIRVSLGGKRIRKVERFDLKGRVVSTTTFSYPGPVVID